MSEKRYYVLDEEQYKSGKPAITKSELIRRLNFACNELNADGGSVFKAIDILTNGKEPEEPQE